MAGNQVALTIALVAVALYFSAHIAHGLLRYRRFRRLQPTAILTWPVPRSTHRKALLALGIVAGFATILNLRLHYSFHVVYSQAVIALYFILMVPLSGRIHLGLYEGGLWSETGFVPYDRIGRVAFREAPELVLLVLPRNGSGAFRLPVPPGEYGAVRRILGDKIRHHGVHLDEGILGL